MSNDASKRSVCIRASYWINGEAQEARCFDESNVEPSRMGLPVGTDPVKPEAGETRYSGMHDQGPLSTLKEGGSFAVLLGCVEKGRAFNDDFLTEKIKEEKDKSSSNGCSQPTKKTKTGM